MDKRKWTSLLGSMDGTQFLYDHNGFQQKIIDPKHIWGSVPFTSSEKKSEREESIFIQMSFCPLAFFKELNNIPKI